VLAYFISLNENGLIVCDSIAKAFSSQHTYSSLNMDGIFFSKLLQIDDCRYNTDEKVDVA
jgi:hypothetical protein